MFQRRIRLLLRSAPLRIHTPRTRGGRYGKHHRFLFHARFYRREEVGHGAALAAFCYAPTIITRAHETITPAKQSPFQQQLPPPAFRGLLGNYNGKARLSRGLCTMHFELQGDRQHPGTFVADSTLTCRPQRRMYVTQAAVSSSVLSGQAQTDAIHFMIDEIIAQAECAPTAFSVKPFGMAQLIVHWEDACKGGTMIVNRAN
jgi:hypothetical protein